MTGKDQRSRAGRRGNRRGGRESEEVAAQAAPAEMEASAAEAQPLPGQLPADSGSDPEAGSPSPAPAAAPPPPPTAAPMLPAAALLPPPAALPTIGEEKRLDAGEKKVEGPARSPTAKLLSKLPTPVRSPKSMDTTPKSQGAATATDRFGATAARGPEPWGISDPAAAPSPAAAAAAKGGYREWLQARGQQAMQRSLMQPSGRQGPPPPPAAPAPCPGAVTGVLSGLGAPPAAPAQVQLQQWFGPGMDISPMAGGRPAMMMPGCGTPLAYSGQGTLLAGQQSPMAFGSLCQPLTYSGCTPTGTPLGGQQSPMAFGSLSQPLTYGGCTPTATTPVPAAAFGLCSTQPPPVAGALHQAVGQLQQKDCSQQELMAALMLPGGFGGLDNAQIAEQLRAAAPCCYDD